MKRILLYSLLIVFTNNLVAQTQIGADINGSADNVLGFTNFLKDEEILPIQNLKEHISNTLQLTCESWFKTSNYHKILFKNEILPIDLSISSKTLENYFYSYFTTLYYTT